MVLMWGLELTLFAVVMFAWTPASTWAAVNESALTAVWVVAASAAVRIASGAASARAAAAATANRVRVDDMAGGPPAIVRETYLQIEPSVAPVTPSSSGNFLDYRYVPRSPSLPEV